jgi:hydroxyacylglutathione hydrolase
LTVVDPSLNRRLEAAMTQEVNVLPLFSPWGRFGLYSFFIDAPEPAIVDTGIASSPASGMAPALAALGHDIADVRWILLTHGHIDHVGGAYALRELTGRRAQVVIGAADAPLLRSRQAHVAEYLAGRGRYLRDVDGAGRVATAAGAVISGELEPTLLVTGGESIPLGGGVTVSVHSLPGHTAGSVGYLIDGQR